MSLQDEREKLCLLLNECHECEYAQDQSTRQKQGYNSSLGSAQVCKGCDHYKRIQEQYAVVETMQKERRQAKGIYSEQDITWKKQGRKGKKR